MEASTPTEIRLSKDKRILHVSFENGEKFSITSELLRVESPSAEVQGHDPSQKKIIPGKRNVEIINILPIGNYAVRLVFDDMHDTGIFSWDSLYEMGSNSASLMDQYIQAMKEKGLER